MQRKGGGEMSTRRESEETATDRQTLKERPRGREGGAEEREERERCTIACAHDSPWFPICMVSCHAQAGDGEQNPDRAHRG
jgi:hypothetical protein